MGLKIYNTFSRKKEEFKPIDPPNVGVYTCGPTVYDFAHIGNFRTYVSSDIVFRVLEYLGFKVKSVMNITDVGHLVTDADEGEDKLEKGARREGKTAWEIAKKYTRCFLADAKKMNVVFPTVLCKATENIGEQIKLIQKLERKGYTYKTSDGVYFDTSRFLDYGKLARLDKEGLREGARVRKNQSKRNPTDFALWKFSPRDRKRDMEWDSPWSPPGVEEKVKGFPGWHIECSAMSMKYLGQSFDIHIGGIDLLPVHHVNEIAQSEAATGRKFVNYWIHSEYLLVDGGKMSKSKGNFYSVGDLGKKGFNPLSLRYLYLTAHYRKRLNFTLDALKAAQVALDKLYSYMRDFGREKGKKVLSQADREKINEYGRKFREVVSSDFSMPGVLVLVWQIVKSDIPDHNKYEILLDWDRILGLDLRRAGGQRTVTKEVRGLVRKREVLRRQKKWDKADKLRKTIEGYGYKVRDVKGGTEVERR